MKKFFGVAIGSIFVYFVLTVCRMNLATLNKLIANNMMQLFLIAIFVYVLFLVSYINIKVELPGSYYRGDEYFPKRYLIQLVFWTGIVLNYLTPPLHQMNFHGDLLSVLFDIAFCYSSISIGIFILYALNKRRINSKMEEQKKDSNAYFYSDNPVINNKDDRLNREKFVNHVISSLNKINGENLTIGFYGKWGTGKTSIFKMIKEKIEEEDNKNEYLIFEFKPWYFGKEDHEIIVEFLEQLLNEIRKSSGFDPEIEKNIIKYSNALSSVSLRLPGITINLKETHSLIEDLFGNKSQSIKDIKEAIEGSLENSNKKIVVFIDDIDRLNKEEIQTIFRLVRLICDFPNITYIVALDEEIVAAALAELHGKDENVDAKKIGRDYLEKFIQIPLYIPETDVYSLNEMLWNGIREILDENHLLEESMFLSEEFSSSERRINLQKIGFTPRNINRYLNVVKFMVPLLKDETHVDDLLYLILIKVGAPNLYETIMLTSEVFLDSNAIEDKAREKIRKEYVGYEKILMRLFPNFIVTSNEESVAKDVYAIEMKNRVCSKDYFKRYFMYDIPQSERVILDFIEKLKGNDIKLLSTEFESSLNLYSAEKIFSIIEYNIDKMNEIQYQNMIKVLQLGIMKERKNSLTHYTNEYARIISLISVYLGEDNENPILLNSMDISLLNKIYKNSNGYFLNGKSFSTIQIVEENKVDHFLSILKNWVKKYLASNQFEDIFDGHSVEDSAELILWWNKIEDTERKRNVIRKWIKNENDFKKVLELIMYSQNEKEMKSLERYTKIVELIAIDLIKRYVVENTQDPDYNQLLNIRDLGLKELDRRMDEEEYKSIKNERLIKYSLLRREIEILEKYGDNAAKNIILRYKKRSEEYNVKRYQELLEKEELQKEILEQFEEENDFTNQV